MREVMVAMGLLLAFGCDSKRADSGAVVTPQVTPIRDAAAAPPAATHADRKALIDAVNQRVDLGFRLSFGDSDVELSVEFADEKACTTEALGKLAATVLAPMQDAGFEHIGCEPAPIDVAAKKLFADYEENEVSADTTYRDKNLRVTGIIWKVAKDFDGKPYVELAADQYGFKNVWAYFDDESRLGTLKKGEKLVSKCRGRGVTVMNSPILKNCAIEHVFHWEPAK